MADDLLPIVEEADKNTQQYYLNKIFKIELSEGKYYSKNSFEYKVLQLALKVCENISDFTNKIYFKGKCIKEFSVKDEVVCSYKEKDSNKTLVLSLAELLPSHKDQSEGINTIKSLFQDRTVLDKFLEAKGKPLNEICAELKIKKNLTAKQVIFIFYYEKCILNEACSNFNFFIGKDFVFDFINTLYENNINIGENPFISHLSNIFKGKYFNNDYISTAEQLSPYIEEWADTIEKRNYLEINGVKKNNDKSILFRKSFIENSFFNIDSLTNQELSDSIDYFFNRYNLQKPFIGDNQATITKNLLHRNLKDIEKIIDWNLFCRQSDEWNSKEYIEWRKDHISSIRFCDNTIPFNILYKKKLFATITDTIKKHYFYDFKNKCLYVNKNDNLDNILFLVAKEAKTAFDMDDYQILCREGKVMISKEDAEKLKHYDELEAEIKILRKQLNIQKSNYQYKDKEAEVMPIITKGNLSKEKQIEAHKEAEQVIREALEKAGYDCTEWILGDEMNNKCSSYNQVKGVIKDEKGDYIDIIVKSAKGGIIHLSATDFEMLTSDRRNILMVWDGKDVHSITSEDVFNQEREINLVFDVAYTPKQYI
ncbi:hypothetical protein [Capnocytophaga leadbetteri]